MAPTPDPRKAPRNVPRRKVLHWLAAAPAAAAAGGSVLAQEIEEFGKLDEFADSKDKEKEDAAREAASADARCIADAQEDLSRKERRALLEKMKGVEGAVKTLREFEIADHVEPALLFRPLGSPGRGAR